MTTGWGADGKPVPLSGGLWQDMPQDLPDYEAERARLAEMGPEDRIEAAMRYMRRILYGPEDEEHLDGTEPS